MLSVALTMFFILVTVAAVTQVVAAVRRGIAHRRYIERELRKIAAR